MEIFPEKSKTMVLTEAEALEFFAFLLSSARSQLDDPALYASMRLLTAAEELREFIRERVSPETQALLADTDDLTTRAQIYMSDIDAYTADLDELCRMTAQFFVEQSDLKENES
ncbi:MAG: hypothetical protein KAJ53_05505 [Anaerolineales bacterium]|nr:hypothetical protein [Anaerolineales bacterium]